ncbi:MAG: hypothetical protein Q9M33_13035, partial [Robiginitomaculum sp.]|nr:hypothetical protein [Robiginitomaculum sp.]
ENTNLKGVNLSRAFTYKTRLSGTDLSLVSGLKQEQVDMACGDDDTILPPNLKRPAHWPCGS